MRKYVSCAVNELFIGVFWSVYYILHSALATSSAKRFFQRIFPQVYPHYRALFITIAVVNFILLLLLHFKLPSPLLFEPPFWLLLIAYGFFAVGLYVIIVASRQYGIGLLLNTSEEGNENPPLITHGLNRIVRHPLYFSVLLVLVGLCCYAPNAKNVVFSLISTVYIVVGSRLEEQRLVERYGEDYTEYQRKVPMLIPYLF